MVNYDSDQAILDATVRKDGGFYFPDLDYHVNVQGQPDAGVLSQWCGLVRSERERKEEQKIEEGRARLAAQGRGRRDPAEAQDGGGSVPAVAEDISGPQEDEGLEDFLVRKRDALYVQRDKLIHVLEALEREADTVNKELSKVHTELEKLAITMDALGVPDGGDSEEPPVDDSEVGGNVLPEDGDGGS